MVLVRQVGCGAASKVYYALCRRSHMPLAVKIYDKSKLSKLNQHQVRAGPSYCQSDPARTEAQNAQYGSSSPCQTAVRDTSLVAELLTAGGARGQHPLHSLPPSRD